MESNRRQRARERIGDEERVDSAYEDAEAEKRREVYARERSVLEQMLKRRREEMPLHERLQRVLSDIARIQTAPAGAIARGRGGGGDEQIGPPPAETIHVFHHLRVIEARVREMEIELDTFRGVTSQPGGSQLRGFEKDALITGPEFRGMHARDVHDAAPYLGSERTIRRIRSLAGQDVHGIDRPPRPDR